MWFDPSLVPVGPTARGLGPASTSGLGTYMLDALPARPWRRPTSRPSRTWRTSRISIPTSGRTRTSGTAARRCWVRIRGGDRRRHLRCHRRGAAGGDPRHREACHRVRPHPRRPLRVEGRRRDAAQLRVRRLPERDGHHESDRPNELSNCAPQPDAVRRAARRRPTTPRTRPRTTDVPTPTGSRTSCGRSTCRRRCR